MSTVPIHTLTAAQLLEISKLPTTTRKRKLYKMPDGNLMALDAARAKYGAGKRKFENLVVKDDENNSSSD